MTPQQAKARFCTAIQKEFRKVVVRNRGHLEQKASEIGVRRQQLEQYASGTVPRSEVLLTAFIKWGFVIRIDDPNAEADDPNWWECRMRGKDSKKAKSKPGPVQLPLFKAIESLKSDDMDVKVIRREPGRIVLGLDILFRDKVG